MPIFWRTWSMSWSVTALPLKMTLPAVRLFQPVQAAQERGFAAAGGADQHHAVAFVNGQVYAFQHLQAAVILLSVL